MTLKEEMLADLKATIERQRQIIRAQRLAVGLLLLAVILATLGR